MAKRHPNHRLVKILRSYSVEEVANLFGIHKNTVRIWVKAGLPISDDKRPMLILGSDLADFLKARRTKNKQSCKPGEFYCFRCRAPRSPAGEMVDYHPVTEKFGNLTAFCPACECMMKRCISRAKLEQVFGKMQITFPQALRQVSDSLQPSVNSDLK